MPEGMLDDSAMARVSQIVGAVQADLDDARASAHCLPVVLTEPDWNLDRLRSRILAQIGPALDTQRNRLRIEARTGSLRREAGRVRRGLKGALDVFSGRDGPKHRPPDGPPDWPVDGPENEGQRASEQVPGSASRAEPAGKPKTRPAPGASRRR